VQSLLAAPRKFVPTDESVTPVLESNDPSAFTRATTRGIVGVVDVRLPTVTLAARPYPGTARHVPSAERVSNPSLVAVPLATSGRFAPLAAAGMATDCTRAPAGVYSSRNTALPVGTRLPVPVPAR
jgi:hypothetical protein